jgi:hypothetical protein
MDVSLTNKNENAGAGIHCKLFSFYLSLGQHATHFDREIEAVSNALRELFSRNGSFNETVIFSDSTAEVLSIAKFEALPSKRITEIY